MRLVCIITFVLLLFTGQTLGQKGEARLVDQFPRIPCGDAMGRMEALIAEWLQNTEDTIAIVYRSHRFRKNNIIGSNGRAEAIQLNYSHPDDGLNWAKGIPKYLLARLAEVNKQKELAVLEKQIVMIDAGYDEEIRVEIWLVPPGVSLPKPVARLNREDIKFAAKNPYRIPDHINCYSMYK